MTVKRNYVSNADLLAAIKKYKRDHNKAVREKVQLPVCPDAIGRMIMLICERLASRYNFVNYTYKDEMIADALENCSGAILKFNPRKSTNAHAYFTMIAWNAFVRRIGKEQKQNAVKHANLENMQVLMDEVMGNGMSHGGGDAHANEGRRRHYEVIEKYEKKLNKKKKAKK